MPPELVPAWVLIPVAFLLGSIPFGFLIARAKGVDIRKHGSRNVGATNVGRVLGKKFGRLCFVLDAGKGLLPTVLAGLNAGLLGRWMPPPEAPSSLLALWLAVPLAAVLGHVFCPWLGFRGGKGVATSAGGLLGVFPVMTLAVLVAGLVWLAVFKLKRVVSIASLAAAGVVPLATASIISLAPASASQNRWLATAPLLVLSLGLAAFVVYTHRENIARLRAGNEHAFRPAEPLAATAAPPPDARENPREMARDTRAGTGRA
ncbi:MAG: glycerol-3-phosphate 1-O-acyltransferase PlsY [Planctomycetota bacterium]|nr:glycerol-3-phosphate 1-O-acyltransferase PlsY [Planctomycetota bacterium]